MIGNTIFKYRALSFFEKNKYFSLWTYVLIYAFVGVSLYSEDSITQPSVDSKVKTPAATTNTSENVQNDELDDDTEEGAEENTESAPPIPGTTVSDTEQNQSDTDLVEVIPHENKLESNFESTVELIPRKEYLDYRERRTTHGFLFNINIENLYFQDYQSIIDQKLYEELFGQEDISMAQILLNYKLNFFLGALTIGAGYGQGTLIDDRSTDETGAFQERSLTIAKTSVQAQWLLDNLIKEPYLVPYAGISFWQMELTEKNTTTKVEANYNTGYGTALTVGLLVQLNWIEPEISQTSYLAQGLENTYLDVFWTQYQATDEPLDPNFENDFNFGAGLRMEF